MAASRRVDARGGDVGNATAAARWATVEVIHTIWELFTVSVDICDDTWTI